jgi:TatD DNase family protein
MTTLVDTHTHLQMKTYRVDRDDVIDRARREGVTSMVNVGYDLPSSRQSIDLARQYPNTFVAAVGIHPHDAITLDGNTLDRLRAIAHDDAVVAIGEIGLDYHRDLSPREVQRRATRQQIHLALERGLPVILHVRKAYQDMLTIVEEVGIDQGIFHCFSGSIDHARRAVELGFHIAFGGSITYGGSRLASALQEVPRDRLLLETDSPYLAPVPHRGGRNEPAFLTLVCKRVADILGLPPEDVAQFTSHNASTLFPLLQRS